VRLQARLLSSGSVSVTALRAPRSNPTQRKRKQTEIDSCWHVGMKSTQYRASKPVSDQRRHAGGGGRPQMPVRLSLSVEQQTVLSATIFSVKQTINHFLAPPSAHKSIQRRHVRLGSLIYLCITIVQPSRANTKVLFLSLHSLIMHLYPLIGRHNRSSNSVAGDEAQLRTMFQKHVAWGGKTILHVRNGSLRASSKWKSYNQCELVTFWW
jgi:hypothetical protein